MKTFLLAFLSAFAFTGAQAQCSYTLTLLNSFGDGWNGNTIELWINGTTTTYGQTFTSGSTQIHIIAVASGDSVAVIWQGGGSFQGECSYELADNYGGVVYTSGSGSSMTAGAVDYGTIGASPTSGNISATTSCVASQVSWSEGFESWGASGSAVIPACWSGIKTSTSGFGWTIDQGGTTSSGTGPSSGNMGDWYLYLETSGGSLGSQSFAELPPLDLSSVSSPILRFYYHMFGASMGTLSVEVSTNAGLNWSVVDTIIGQQNSSNSDSYSLKDVSLANYISPSTLIRFVGERGSSYTGDMAIDDIYVGDCPPATDVAISSVGRNSTTISWTSSSGDNKLEYGPTGFTQGTGTQVSPATSPVTLTGLQGSTTYDVYIQDSCSATSVVWVGL